MAVPSAVAGLLRRPARLGDEVYSAIFSRIMALEIAAGTRISVDALARELNVSPTPIREALARLESEGLVLKTHLVGYSAAPQLSIEQFNELYEMRLLLEPFAAAEAAEAMDDAAVEQLEGLCAEMAELAQSEGASACAQFAQFDMALHDQIVASAGNRLLIEGVARLHTHAHLFRLGRGERVTSETLHEHHALVAAIRAHDSAGAQAAMRTHIEASRERFAGHYRQ